VNSLIFLSKPQFVKNLIKIATLEYDPSAPGHPVDAADNRGWMPIHEVAHNNSAGGMRLLLQYGEIIAYLFCYDFLF